jgi:hypothetical protein
MRKIDKTKTLDVHFTVAERFKLATFCLANLKPSGRGERKQLDGLFSQLDVDDWVDALDQPEGMSREAVMVILRDKSASVYVLERDLVKWLYEKLDKAETSGTDSVRISKIENRLGEVLDGTYRLPADLEAPAPNGQGGPEYDEGHPA